MQFSTKFTRLDAESSWPEFVGWIGFSTLSEALRRKHASLEEWSAFQEMAPKLFSIEIGLAKILKRWRSTRRVSFPNEKSTYDALEFVGCCTNVKHQISTKEAAQFRRRIISEILPNGRLCHLDHEFRIAQNLVRNGWKINRFGFCGNPGADFVAQRGERAIEVEGKCLSPEIGLGLSYEYAARLLTRINRELRGQNPGYLTKLKIELSGEFHEASRIDTVRQHVIDSYVKSKGFSSGELNISIELSSLQDFLDRFPNVQSDSWLHDTFQALRTRMGDYGYFLRRDNELIFCNLVPTRPNRQMKNVLKLISKTCERQFSGSLPSVLWLHLQGLDPIDVDDDINRTPDFMITMAQHAFGNLKRDHLTAIAFSSDSEIDVGRTPVSGKSARIVTAAGKVRGFDNADCRFGQSPIFAATSFGFIPRRRAGFRS
jgi:hypothetical protein